MVRGTEAAMVRQAETLLKGWLGEDARLVPRSGRTHDNEADVILRTPRGTLVVQAKSSDRSTSLAPWVGQAKVVASHFGRGAVPVLVVPYMGDLGQRLCREAGVSWFDLSGNAEITAPGLRIHVEGKPNKFKRRGRPSTVFAPRSSRIARVLLMQPDEAVNQRELARVAGVDEGFTSRIVRTLEADELVERDDSGVIRVTNPSLLLDAWRERYDFSKHRVLKGHVPARSAEQSLHQVVEALRRPKVKVAVTGLSGAWLLTKFAGFRLSTILVDEEPDAAVLAKSGFREDERGANTWIVVPNDGAVFLGAEPRDGLPCAHPLQVYLDLKAHPERAEEAAAEVRKRLLKGDL
jgi:hypothetical protein